MTGTNKPMIALAMGDPAGIGAELAARLLIDQDIADAADVLLIGDRRVLALGERQAGIEGSVPDLDGFPEQGQASCKSRSSRSCRYRGGAVFGGRR